jgi:hypothetical protein
MKSVAGSGFRAIFLNGGLTSRGVPGGSDDPAIEAVRQVFCSDGIPIFLTLGSPDYKGGALNALGWIENTYLNWDDVSVVPLNGQGNANTAGSSSAAPAAPVYLPKLNMANRYYMVRVPGLYTLFCIDSATYPTDEKQKNWLNTQYEALIKTQINTGGFDNTTIGQSEWIGLMSHDSVETGFPFHFYLDAQGYRHEVRITSVMVPVVKRSNIMSIGSKSLLPAMNPLGVWTMEVMTGQHNQSFSQHSVHFSAGSASHTEPIPDQDQESSSSGVGSVAPSIWKAVSGGGATTQTAPYYDRAFGSFSFTPQSKGSGASSPQPAQISFKTYNALTGAEITNRTVTLKRGAFG